MLTRIVVTSCALLTTFVAGAEGLRGEPQAIAAAQQLLEKAGGAAAWRSSLFEASERTLLNSGQQGELRIVRDFSRSARLLESVTPGRTVTEWISPDGGWVRRDGVVTPLTAEQLAAELQGLRQEPYAIYHRLARNDSSLRVELRSNLIYFYDRDERLLCWFQVAPNGVLLSWANFYDGAINQHYYGPPVDLGDVNLPKFGISSTGSFRFEYVSARLSNEELVMPETNGTRRDKQPADR